MIEENIRLAEEFVLGSIFLDESLIKGMILMPKHFYYAKNRMIFQKMQELEEASHPIDVYSVMVALGDMLDQVGGSTYLNDVACHVPSIANVDFYIEEVIKGWKQRESLKVTIELQQQLKSGNMHAIYDANTKLMNINEADLATEYDLHHQLLAYIDYIQEEKGELTGIDTGYKGLNSITGGLQEDDLIIIGARPSIGKTAFALNIGMNALGKGTAVAIASLEMNYKQLLNRMVSRMGNINSMKMRNCARFFHEKEWKMTTNIIAKMDKRDLELWDKPGITIQEIYAQARRFRHKHKEKKCLLIIDYLQLITGEQRYNSNRMQEISEISRKLKVMARDLHICIIALSQLSRGVEHRQNKRPMLSDLRESGQIEQDADLIAFLYRDDYYDNKSEEENVMEVIIAKHRNGPTGLVKLAFLKEYSKFVELERDKV
ncbi:replicative DNA helicase [Priestia taiwanensis]|uniref:Replicative DNA helicase n=1 Tax=Priestia taiwanensis TaxID=1347902 RepID=A0A917AJV7_9BACI|nr:replicative DNA helicase [Priestia taiwanensis]MBM7361918.1 replicative DNA helicase [Priestia taiwanensis]GGE57986.1 replicative DNA helicase [Priestia taiwanensis]